MTRKTSSKPSTTRKASPAKATAEPTPQPTTGPRSGTITRRKPRAADQGHTMVMLIGPYLTKSGKSEVTWRCECGKTLRPYGDAETAVASHARHARRALSAAKTPTR